MWIGVGKGKGGSGCTTTALELAHAAARRRSREDPPRGVAYLDLDPQGDGTTVLEPERLTPGLKDVLLPPGAGASAVPLRQVLAPSVRPGMLVAPASRYLANRDLDMGPAVSALRRARESGEIDDLAADVIVDLPKDLGKLAMSGLLAVESLFIVARASLWSAQGAEEMRYTADRIRARWNPELRIAGVAVTEYDDSRDAKRIIRDIRESKNLGKLILTPLIPRNVLVRESVESFHTPLRDFGDPGLTEIADIYQGMYDTVRAQHERAGQ
ncbi:ParA family protein [Streptomyces sp. 891-h]|uniref:ParA family protein n=1 Tax=Streptomyces sp. 891-h TaxID=2720714 RepID=UPI001FAA8213|nr:ParA family protein [Streptomyces sp. 891-h]UNZ22296.1 ParA family protein [Streptomyces sp. 891-h]